MLMIRLQRIGRKNHAEFRVVVTEKTRAAQSANYVELLGHYNPHTSTVTLNEERVSHWLSIGAQPSGTVHNMLVEKGIVKGKKRNVLPKKTPIKKEVVEEAPAEQPAEAPAETKEEVATEESSKE